jgi:hypothetical protein
MFAATGARTSNIQERLLPVCVFEYACSKGVKSPYRGYPDESADTQKAGNHKASRLSRASKKGRIGSAYGIRAHMFMFVYRRPPCQSGWDFAIVGCAPMSMVVHPDCCQFCCHPQGAATG